MAARKAIKSINWGALAERVPESEKLNFAAFKAKSEKYLRDLEENPPEPPKIDWSYYKSKISSSSLVDKFQKEYETLKIKYPDDKYTVKVEEQEKQAEAAVQQFITESNKRIEAILVEAKVLEGMMKYRDMTMEDFKDLHPNIAMDPNKPSIYPHTEEYQPVAHEEKSSGH